MRQSEMCFHLCIQKLKLDDVEQAFSYFVAGLPLMKFNSFGVRANIVLVCK